MRKGYRGFWGWGGIWEFIRQNYTRKNKENNRINATIVETRLIASLPVADAKTDAQTGANDIQSIDDNIENASIDFYAI